MKTATSVAPSLTASSKPAIRPRYSATLLVALPMACLLSASTVDRSAVQHHGAVAGRPGVAARPAVGFDDNFHWSNPLTRNKIAPHSGHRTNSSSAAAEMRDSSPRSISIRQAPHRRPSSGPAPGPPPARCRS